MHVCRVLSHFSFVQLFATPWTVAQQSPLSMGYSRQEYWSGLSYPSPEDLPDTGLNPFLMSHALASWFFTTSATCEVQHKCIPRIFSFRKQDLVYVLTLISLA